MQWGVLQAGEVGGNPVYSQEDRALPPTLSELTNWRKEEAVLRASASQDEKGTKLNCPEGLLTHREGPSTVAICPPSLPSKSPKCGKKSAWGRRGCCFLYVALPCTCSLGLSDYFWSTPTGPHFSAGEVQSWGFGGEEGCGEDRTWGP